MLHSIHPDVAAVRGLEAESTFLSLGLDIIVAGNVSLTPKWGLHKAKTCLFV